MSTNLCFLTMTQNGDTRLSNASVSGAPLQLTQIVLGNHPTSIAYIKQATEIKNEIYRAALNRVKFDRKHNFLVCEWTVPQDKKNVEVHEIGFFEHDTLVAIGHSSPVDLGLSPYPVSIEEEIDPLAQNIMTGRVHIPINNRDFLSAIEEVTPLINLEDSDSRYLDAAENLKDIHDKSEARLNLGLGAAATKNVDTDDNGLMTRSAADTRYLTKVSKLIDYFHLIFGDIDGVSYLLRPGLTSDELESWLTNVSNLKNFTVVADSTSAMAAVAASTTAMTAVAASTTAMTAVAASTTAMTAVAASTTAMNAIVASPAAMNEMGTSLTAKEILRNSPKAMAVIGQNSMAIAKLATGLVGLNPRKHTDMTAVAASPEAMTAVAASTTAMTAVAASTTAMNAIVASPAAMNEMGTSLTAKEILRNSPKAMAVIGQNSMAIAKLATGLVGLNPRKHTDMTAVAASPEAMTAVAASPEAMTAVVNSGLALNAIVKSESACVAIEINLQNHRSTVKQTLNGASPNLFKKESTLHQGSTTGTHEHNQGAANIIILTNWSHLKTHYGLHSTLGSHQKLADLYQYSSSSSTPSCVALRGIRIVGNDSSADDNIDFDVYTAV